MKYICIDTSGERISVAAVGKKSIFLCDDGFVKASRALMPMLDSALEKAQMSLSEAEFIAVVIGPGSFTGVRIGVSAARALAYALKVKLVPINSCELAAYNSKSALKRSGKKKTLVFSDAGNGFAFVAGYDESGAELMPPACVGSDEARAILSDKKDFFAVGDRKLSEMLGTAKAEGDGLMSLAPALYEERKTDFESVEPLYVRKSQAELTA